MVKTASLCTPALRKTASVRIMSAEAPMTTTQSGSACVSSSTITERNTPAYTYEAGLSSWVAGIVTARM